MTAEMGAELITIDRHTVEASGTPVALIDADDVIVAVSAGMCDLLMSEPEHLVGVAIHQMFRSDARHWALDEMVSVLRRDKVALAVRIQVVELDRGANRLVVVYDVSEQQRRMGDLSFRAGHEPSSRLPNRAAATEQIQELLHRGHPVAIIAIELSRLEGLLPLLGDDLVGALVGVAARRVEQLGQGGEVIAHVGPAHLLFASPDLEDDEDLLDFGVAVVDAVGRSVELGASSFRTSAVCGVTVAHPWEAADSAIRDALLALMHASSRRQDVARFASEMREVEQRQLLMELELQDALANDALELHLQPVVDVRDGGIVSFEALARWTHPQFGEVSPAEFIALAEQTGLIRSIGEWGVRRTLEYVVAARRNGRALPPIAINFSPSQLLDSSFIEYVADAVERHQAWGAIAVEVTEGVLISEGAIEALRQLASRGISIAIDDFGTGFSALSYLAEVPASTVKIDRSFVLRLSEPRSYIVVSGIIALAHALGLRVIAEGVEAPEMLDQLRDLGCDSVQGYLTGRPGPVDVWWPAAP
jgi:diguanylate cyclase